MLSAAISGWLAPAAPSPASAVARLDDTETLLRKKIELLEADLAKAHAAALRYNKSGDKRRAVAQLRRKHALEKQVAQRQAQVDNLQRQLFALENHNVAHEVIGAMRSGNEALRAANHAVSVDDVDTLVGDIEEQLGEASRVNELLAQPLDNGEQQYDDDELERELADLVLEDFNDELHAQAAARSTAGAEALRNAPAAPLDEPRASNSAAAAAAAAVTSASAARSATAPAARSSSSASASDSAARTAAPATQPTRAGSSEKAPDAAHTSGGGASAVVRQVASGAAHTGHAAMRSAGEARHEIGPVAATRRRVQLDAASQQRYAEFLAARNAPAAAPPKATVARSSSPSTATVAFYTE